MLCSCKINETITGSGFSAETCRNMQKHAETCIHSQKVALRSVLSIVYLSCTGIEPGHAFIFRKLKTKHVWLHVWLVSIGIALSGGISGYHAIKLYPPIVWKREIDRYIAILANDKAKPYAEYAYITLTSMGIKTVLFSN